MAAISDSSLMSTQMIVKSTGLNLKNGVFGVSLIPHRACRLNLRKLKCNNYNKVRIGVKAVMQVSVEEAESLSVSKGLELGFDVVSEGELRERGFLGLRKTKLVCTIGPACSSLEDLEKLALGGMNVARLNMCHNTREWHKDVIRKIKQLNDDKGVCVSVMIDTEGSQHVVDHGAPTSVKAEVKIIITH